MLEQYIRESLRKIATTHFVGGQLHLGIPFYALMGKKLISQDVVDVEGCTAGDGDVADTSRAILFLQCDVRRWKRGNDGIGRVLSTNPAHRAAELIYAFQHRYPQVVSRQRLT